MQLTLEPTRDILSLYTPFATYGKLRVHHTRSVLLQKEEASSSYTIVSSVCFALVISLPQSVPIDYLLRHMLSSYNRYAYAIASKENEMNRHAALWKQQPVEGEEPFIDNGVKGFIRRIDIENRRDYETVLKKRLLAADNNWQWFNAGRMEIEDEEYREMRNINFIRDVKQVSVACSDKKKFLNTAQYRILFDNHLILYYFLKQFKYGSVKLEHNEEKFDCPLVLLDPVASPGGANKHERFEGANYIYYIEKQLNSKENRDFHQTLHFKNVYTCLGGLLHPSGYETNDSLHLHEKNSAEAMHANSLYEDNTGQRLTKKQQEGSKAFRLRYNRFYVDLSTESHRHVEYIEREKTLINVKIVSKPKKTPIERKPSKEVKRSEKQPTLHTVVSKIPEEAKRKLEEALPAVLVEPSPIPTKKPRLEQGNLKSFFFNQ